MRDEVRVVVLGTGRMGSGVARLLLSKPAMRLVGVFARRVERHGMDAGFAIGLDRPLDLAVSGELTALLESTRPDIAIQATCSLLADALPELHTLLRHRVAVISVAEEMAYPAAASPATAEALERLARNGGVAVLGTGINPGFVMDLLVILLTGVCFEVHAIDVERVNDLSPYGPTVLASQGVGLSEQAFRNAVASGAVSGHRGFPESISMVARALGWRIERIEQRREPILSQVRRETSHVIVQPGQTAGCLHCATGYRDGKPVINLRHPQQIHPHLEGVVTGDRIEIHGTPDVRLAGSPEIEGGTATAALAVNMVPRVLAAAPGLYSMADLPVPCAIPTDVAAWHPPGRTRV